jgi:integrase/recombinase XerD
MLRRCQRKNPHHNVSYGVAQELSPVGGLNMSLATTFQPPAASNADEHAGLIAGWQLAQSSPHTLRAYSLNLADFCSWLDAHSLDLLQVRRVHVDGYRHTLTGAPTTVARTLSAISSFYRYAVAEEQADRNPVQAVSRPVVDADFSSTQGLTRDQARDLLAVAKADSHRSSALANVLMLTGVRISEALNTSISSYGHDSGHRTLTITRKGGTMAQVPLPAPAVEALNLYLGTSGADLVAAHLAGQQGSSGAPLFTTRTGKRWNRSEAFRTIQRLAKTAHIEGAISPHSLRHTFVTIALDNGVPLHLVQDSLGHADPRTTRRYDRKRNNLVKFAGYDVARALA